jgi:hypothetical protein
MLLWHEVAFFITGMFIVMKLGDVFDLFFILFYFTRKSSGSQPGCRELVPGVPPIVTFPWYLYLLNKQGVPPSILNTE